MKASDFQLTEGDRNFGTVYLPDRVPSRLPVMIVCHGWAGNRALDPFRQELCARLTGRGVAVVTPDFFGCGDTGGSYADMTYGRWTRNLGDVHAWVTHQDWADSDRIGSLGVSSGSTAALRQAVGQPKIAYVISIATCLGLYINMPTSPARTYVQETRELLDGATAHVFGVPFPAAFFRDFVEHAPIFSVRDIDCPVLFLQGSKDNPYWRSDAWLGDELRQHAGKTVAYVEIESGDHGLNLERERSVETIIGWLDSLGLM